MAEEQRCGEGHRLCANNCGFFGSPATLNLCSKCYRDYRLKEDQATSAKVAVEKSFHQISSASSSSSIPTPLISTVISSSSLTVEHSSPTDAATSAPSVPSRCLTCRKKVGLTGFKCRCGSTFCGIHRYPEQHACIFDFKSAGRDAIAKSNPLVKADKLDNKL